MIERGNERHYDVRHPFTCGATALSTPSASGCHGSLGIMFANFDYLSPITTPPLCSGGLGLGHLALCNNSLCTFCAMMICVCACLRMHTCIYSGCIHIICLWKPTLRGGGHVWHPKGKLAWQLCQQDVLPSDGMHTWGIKCVQPLQQA